MATFERPVHGLPTENGFPLNNVRVRGQDPCTEHKRDGAPLRNWMTVWPWELGHRPGRSLKLLIYRLSGFRDRGRAHHPLPVSSSSNVHRSCRARTVGSWQACASSEPRALSLELRSIVLANADTCGISTATQCVGAHYPRASAPTDSV